MAGYTSAQTETGDDETRRLKEEVSTLKDKLAKMEGAESLGTGSQGQNYQSQSNSQPYQNENIMARYKQMAQGQIGAQHMLARAYTAMFAMMAQAYKQVANAAREMRMLYQTQGMQPAYEGMPAGKYADSALTQKTGKVNYNGR